MHTTETTTPHHDGFDVVVNGKPFTIHDPKPDARAILVAAEFTPADECILIRQSTEGTQVVTLGELVDLRPDGTERFSAFRSDRIYRFTVDGRGFDWGAGEIDEPTLRDIAHVGHDDDLVLERRDEADQVLDAHSVVHISDRGTEHLRIEHGIVTVFFQDEPVKLRRGVYTTEELIAKFPIEPGYLLMLKTHDGLVTLKPGEKIRVVEGMRFYSQPPCGGSS